ncbi:hypothetical protein [Cellulosimicrobium sp. NPDC057862]|uniref:hypothetical protein n=1 Tax=Cellulosimicrobium sp. NPDC057862 TaxID=3346266 RepID=UPI003671E980
MVSRGRPRRGERRASARAARVAAALWAVARARRIAVGAGVVWLVSVAAAVLLVLAAPSRGLVWSVQPPTRSGSPPVEVEVVGAGAVLLVAGVSLAAVGLASVGILVAQRRARDPLDRTLPLPLWSIASVAVAAAVAPNLLGTLALSTLGAGESIATVVLGVWPFVAGPLTAAFVAERAWSGARDVRSAAARGERSTG